MLLTRRCPICLQPARSVCGPCWSARSDPPAVSVPHTDEALALCRYDNISKLVILAAKNHHRRDLLNFLGQQLASLVPQLGIGHPEQITWVPASSEQRRKRGFDQGELLAKGLSRALRVPSAGLLRRDTGEQQVGKNRAQRLAGPNLGLKRRRTPRSVLIVDDVLTTGGSLAAAADVLRTGGASRVGALVVAAKP